MVKVLKTICFVLLVNVLSAQAHHFIYFENTKKEWFTIKANNTTYESVGKNYIIISKLESGIYNFIITTQTAKETAIALNIGNEDKGYSIKVNDNNEVELFDINSFQTVAATVKVSQEIKKEIVGEVVSKPVEISKSTTTVEEAVSKNLNTKTKIEKAFSKKNDDGVDEIYVDGKDTISIFIPADKITNTAPIVEAKPEEKPVLTMSNSNNDIVIKAKNNCKNFANEIDVKNMTIALQAEVKVRERLKLASLFMKEKCYSINQIKRLSSLFINSAGKFQFFKQAQQSISDLNNFNLLETELTEPQIIEEFRVFAKQL